jgi:hypothetical protein
MKEIMKHYNQMNDEELENFDKIIEEKRMSKIDNLVEELCKHRCTRGNNRGSYSRNIIFK